MKPLLDSDFYYTGFIPCKNCGRDLESKESGYHTRYQPLYNGYCYFCGMSVSFLEKTYPNGAKLFNYPPSNPSYRRDREKYVGFENCENCHGEGFTWYYNSWTRLRQYCEKCHKRHYSEKVYQKTEEYMAEFKSYSSKYDKLYVKLNKKGDKKGIDKIVQKLRPRFNIMRGKIKQWKLDNPDWY